MNGKTWVFLLLSLLMIGPLLASCGLQATPTLVATQLPTQTATSTMPPYLPATMTASANQAATATAFANCHHPDQITADMVGQTVCVRGIIKNFVQTRTVGTRYSFSDKANTFFLYDQYYEIIDPNTGKTLAPGTCVELHGTLRAQSSVPYIDLQDLLVGKEFHGFSFYNDSSACNW